MSLPLSGLAFRSSILSGLTGLEGVLSSQERRCYEFAVSAVGSGRR